eukprot:1157317-Pelagomonas_calceolata.AAC.8
MAMSVHIICVICFQDLAGKGSTWRELVTPRNGHRSVHEVALLHKQRAHLGVNGPEEWKGNRGPSWLGDNEVADAQSKNQEQHSDAMTKEQSHRGVDRQNTVRENKLYRSIA